MPRRLLPAALTQDLRLADVGLDGYSRSSRAGNGLLGLGAVLLGASGLFWRDFAPIWQPVSPDLPYRSAAACIVAALLLAGGIAIQLKHTRQIAGWLLAILFFGFSLLWCLQIARAMEIVSNWGGCAEELAVAVGALGAAVRRTDIRGTSTTLFRTPRIGFGMCAILFGCMHFAYLADTAALVPAWLPAPLFWAAATGACHVAAGCAIALGRLARLAALLLTAMFLVFEAFVWIPELIVHAPLHMAWAGNGLNLALAGAAWIVAELCPRTNPEKSTFAAFQAAPDAS